MEEVTKKAKSRLYVPVAVVLAIIVTGLAVYFLGGFGSLTVANGDNVSVYYTGTFTNGTVFDSSSNRGPFQFTVGANEVIPGFDQAVIGMRLNQTKNVTIPVDEAYGPVNPQLIVQVPINAIQSTGSNQSIQVGALITQTSNGQQRQGTVTAVNSTTVTINFNPPLAGRILLFTIKVVGIKAG